MVFVNMRYVRYFLYMNLFLTRRLVDSLGIYWDNTEQTPIEIDQLECDFPGSIKVPQAVATWKYVTEYEENKQ